MNNSELARTLREKLTFPGLPAPRYAVLAPLVLGEHGPELLVEVRAAGISQAGDPCFPGGRIEAGERPVEAAIRETYEELGLTVAPEAVLGQLPTVHTPLGSRTDVFVALIPEADARALRPSPAEVAELLRVPMAFFLSHPGAGSYQVGGHCIWGMTAGAIAHLCGIWPDSPDSIV